MPWANDRRADLVAIQTYSTVPQQAPKTSTSVRCARNKWKFCEFETEAMTPSRHRPKKPELSQPTAGQRNRECQRMPMRQRRAKAVASKDAPANEAVRPRSTEDWAGLKLAAAGAREAMIAAARAARAASVQQEAALDMSREKLDRAEELLKARNTEISNLEATIRRLEEQSPPRMSRSLHRRVLGLLHPDRAHDDEELRRKLEKCFQDFSAIKFTFPE